MVNLMARLGGRGRHNGANAIVHLAREVVGRRRTIQNATQEARNAVILDSLSDEDFRALDATISERTTSDREFAQTLARLTYAAARAKGFDRCVVDAALRLDGLIPVDDPAHERDKLLRDAYNSAQKASYIRGGRLALGRLGRRAVEAGDLERARVLLHQQLDLGPEKDDTAAEVDSALVLGDILRRENEDDQAQTFYRRAGAAAERLEYRQGVAEALVRQIDTTPSANLETVAALQHQALDAAQRTGDQLLEARILVGLADTLVESRRLDEATPYYRSALSIAQDMGDLALEARCVTALAHAHRELGHTLDAIEAERAALGIEERLGNRQAAATWALSLGMSELRLRNAESAIEAFERARLLGNQIGDDAIEQRAEGNLGIANTLLRRGSETIEHLGRAIDLARRSGDQSQEAQWVASLGEAYWMFGQIDDAIRVTNDAITLAEATRNVAMQAESFTLLGQIYAAQRETIRARDCYTRALQLNRDLGQTTDQVTTLSALARLAADTGQFTQASQLFDQALQLAQTNNDRTTMTVLYGRMGSLAQKRGDMRAALGNFQRAFESAQSVGDQKLLSRALQYLATAQDVMGDQQAVTTYERAVTAADDVSDIRGGITMRLNMGMLIGRLPEQGAAEDAIGWLSDAANYAMEAGSDYTELRRQAEDLIQELGGGPNQGVFENDRPGSGLDYGMAQPDMGQDRGGDRYEGDGSDTRDDLGDDDRSYQGRSSRSSENRYDEDERYWAGDRDDSRPYGQNGTSRQSTLSSRTYHQYDDEDRDSSPDRQDDRDPRYRSESQSEYRYPGSDRDAGRTQLRRTGFERDDDRGGGRFQAAYDDDLGRYPSDDVTDVRPYADRGQDREPSYDDEGDDRGPSRMTTSGRDRYPAEESTRRGPDPANRDGGRGRDRDRDRDANSDNDYDEYREPSYADDRNGDRDRAYLGDGNGYRDREQLNGGARAESRGRSRRQTPDIAYGASGSGSGTDRYEEDAESGYDGYQDTSPDNYPRQQRSGRTERAGRRESGRSASPGRGLDDEPSDPDSSSSHRRRSGFRNLFRPNRDVQASRRSSRNLTTGASQPGENVPALPYDDDHEADHHVYS